MRKKVGLLSSPMLGAIVGLSAALVMDLGLARHAAAGGSASPAAIETLTATGHQSLIRVPDNGGAPVHKNIKIGLGKSALVEFPRDVRDVMVSNPAAVDAVVLSANRVFLLARKIGEANAFFFDTTGEQFATFEIFIERETSGLESLLNRLISGAAIKVEMLNQTVVLTGTVKNPTDSVRAANIARQFVNVQYNTSGGDSAKAEGATVDKFEKSEDETVINMLAVEAEEQVMLKVTVAEVQRSLLKQMGVNLGAAINAGNFTTALLTSNALPLTGAAGLGLLPIPGIGTEPYDPTSTTPPGCGNAGGLCNWNAGPGGASTFGNSGLAGAWDAGGNNRVSHAIRALERDGLVRTLAEPTLTAVSGEPANFLAGGEFPIPLVDSTGQVSVSFKQFGIGLAFTPIVLSEGRISLKIETQVSELSNQGAVTLSGISIPALKKREAKSTVELPSGGTLALAGLISDDTRQNIDGLPGLKDVPMLGTLFRSRDFIRNETELVVIVTPYLVRPTARSQIAQPGTGLQPASDRKANFMGELNTVYGKGESLPDGGLKGDYGYIVE